MVPSTHLHAVERLPIPLLPPFSCFLSLPELHQHHVLVCPGRPDEPKMTDMLPRLLSHVAQQIRGRHIRRHGQYTQGRAVLLTELALGCLVIVQTWRLLPIAIQVYHTPTKLGICRLRRYEFAFCRQSPRSPGRQLERFGAGPCSVSVVAATAASGLHVNAQNRDGVEAPVLVRKALGPPVSRTCRRLDERYGTVVALRERGSRASAVSTGV